MNTQLQERRNAAFEHRLALLAASFTAATPLSSRNRVAVPDADKAFQIDNRFSLLDALRRIRDRVAKHLERRAAIAELSALNDATLADIGVPRHMIGSIVDAQLRARAAAATGPGAEQTREHGTWRAPEAPGEAGNASRFDRAA